VRQPARHSIWDDGTDRISRPDGSWTRRESRAGRGLASAAVADVTELAFGELGLHRLDAATLLHNTPSQRVLLRNGFPVNVLNPIKAVPEVCTIFCATANPLDVVIVQTDRGRGIVGVIDGSPPVGVEAADDVTARRALLRDIGYKL